jgi:hypothetical protein
MDIDDTDIVARNSLFLDNGNSGVDDGAVKFGTGTTGEFRFNTVAFNTGKGGGGMTPPTSGVYCGVFSTHVFNLTDNLLAENTGNQLARTSLCDISRTWIGSASTVLFVSAAKPYNVHLTQATPTVTPNIIRDNANTNCGNVTHDFDNAARPYNQACDLGAFEFRPN